MNIGRTSCSPQASRRLSDIYDAQLRRRDAELSELGRKQARVANARLLLAIAAITAGWLHLTGSRLGIAWCAIPAAAFLVLVVYHRRLRERAARVQRVKDFYQRGLDRMGDRWTGAGARGERFRDPEHIYAADLDLFGDGSLFQLLSAARTSVGEHTLAEWLLSPAPVAKIHERQRAIRELRDRLPLREQLATLGEQPRLELQRDQLTAWAESPRATPARWVLWAALSLAGLSIASAVFWSLSGMASPFLVVLVTAIAFQQRQRHFIAASVSGVEQAAESLRLMSALLEHLQQERFEAPSLARAVDRLSSRNLSASGAIGSLATVVNMLESQDNPFLRPLLTPLQYTVQVALAVERWRSRHGASVRAWLDALGEIEALVSLATYSDEHPDDSFPEFIDPEFIDEGARFDGSALGHPLIAAASCIRNDVCLDADTRVLLVSGSNMSGKSTLLRTIGINAVLAMAGAPVRARRLRLSALQVGASIRVNDSLADGRSRFYAEILRLKQLFEAAASLPLLFLLDELLQGTNSNDRRVGTEGVLAAFIRRGAIGVISTHDLALTRITTLPEGTLRNVHFQDEIKNGKLAFDFTLRAGIIERSNGIELMRAVGLDV